MKLFVYGTLKLGLSRARHLAGQRFVGPAITMPQYRMYDCGEFPGLVEAIDGLAIQGELWDVDDECLWRLDEVEGVAGELYRRGFVSLQSPHDEETVIAYFYVRDTHDLRDCGTCWPTGSVH